MLERERIIEERGGLPFPVGVRALLPDDAARRRGIEGAVVGRLIDGGYREIILPVLDFADPYVGVGWRGAAKESYRFIDREGELLTLRADFTPMVARAVAPRIDSLGAPLRIFYRGDVVRCESARLGTNREYFQIGAELVGDSTTAADAEIVRQAIDCAGVRAEGLTVSLGDASIARAALEMPNSDVIRRLFDGTLDLEAASADATTAIAARRVQDLASEIERSGARVVVTFDREDASGYYTGIRFSVFAERATSPIAKGGRYDALYGCFGAEAPAIGFTLNVDAMEAMR